MKSAYHHARPRAAAAIAVILALPGETAETARDIWRRPPPERFLSWAANHGVTLKGQRHGPFLG